MSIIQILYVERLMTAIEKDIENRIWFNVFFTLISQIYDFLLKTRLKYADAAVFLDRFNKFASPN